MIEKRIFKSGQLTPGASKGKLAGQCRLLLLGKEGGDNSLLCGPCVFNNGLCRAREGVDLVTGVGAREAGGSSSSGHP